MTSGFSWVERFYTHFLYRDLCYLSAGGLLIGVVEYTLWGDVYLPNGLSLELISFVLISYFLGLAILSLNDLIGISPSGNVVPEGYSSRLILLQDIIENFDERTLNEYDRVLFNILVGRTVGASSILGAILMIASASFQFILKNGQPSVDYLLITFSLLIFGIVILFDSRSRNKIIQEYEENLAERISSINQNETIQDNFLK